MAEKLPSSDEEGDMALHAMGVVGIPETRYWSGPSMTVRTTPQPPMAGERFSSVHPLLVQGGEPYCRVSRQKLAERTQAVPQPFDAYLR